MDIDFKQILDKYIVYYNLMLHIHKSKALTFENQKTLIEFHNKIAKIDDIYSIMINIRNQQNNYKIQIKYLAKILKELIDIYTNEKSFFADLNTVEICKIESKKSSFSISVKEKELKKISDEQDAIQNMVRHLESSNFNENKKNRLLDKYQNKRAEYLKASADYGRMVSEQNDYYINIMMHYSENIFKKINDLDNKFLKFISENISIFDNTIEIFFDKKLIEEIYNITNKIVFKEISSNDFYNCLNLIDSNEALQLKKDNQSYARYLIKALFDKSKSENREFWLDTILEEIDLKKDFSKRASDLTQKVKIGNRADVFIKNIKVILNTKN